METGQIETATVRERHPDRVRSSESLALVDHDPKGIAEAHGNEAAFDYYNNKNMDSIRDEALMHAAAKSGGNVAGRDPLEGMAHIGAISPTALVGGQPRSALTIPQGLTQTQFNRVSDIVKTKASTLRLGDDIVVQGSRADGTAKPNSDIDIAIKVTPEKFDEFINTQSRLASPNPGSSLSRTRDHAIETGKIQAGEARLRSTAREVRTALGGMNVDLSVIKSGGVFDNSSLQTPLPK